ARRREAGRLPGIRRVEGRQGDALRAAREGPRPPGRGPRLLRVPLGHPEGLAGADRALLRARRPEGRARRRAAAPLARRRLSQVAASRAWSRAKKSRTPATRTTAPPRQSPAAIVIRAGMPTVSRYSPPSQE